MFHKDKGAKKDSILGGYKPTSSWTRLKRMISWFLLVDGDKLGGN